MIPIIDCHCHFGSGDKYSKMHNAYANLRQYLLDVSNTNIKKTILFPHPNCDYDKENKRTAAIVKNNPEKFYQFVIIHPHHDRHKVEKIIKFFKEKKTLKGIKVHRHDAPISKEICDLAKEYSLPVLYDTMGDLRILPKLGELYPNVIFIIPHFGSFVDSWSVHNGIIPYLKEYPNLYTDTSGVRRLDILEKGIHQTNGDKILFGTDSPFLHPVVELTKIKALKLPKQIQKKIFYKNIFRILDHGTDHSDDDLSFSKMEYFLS